MGESSLMAAADIGGTTSNIQQSTSNIQIALESTSSTCWARLECGCDEGAAALQTRSDARGFQVEAGAVAAEEGGALLFAKGVRVVVDDLVDALVRGGEEADGPVAAPHEAVG